MAINTVKIDPLDLQPRKAVGIKLPFSGTAVFNSTYQTRDAKKTNLINYFLTSKGERFLNVGFGNGLQTLLFDQLTEDKVQEIDQKIRQDLAIYFPKVKASKIETMGLPDTNTVQFSMKYQVEDTNIEDEVVLNFEQ
jgi:phage baseplate assembly protein W